MESGFQFQTGMTGELELLTLVALTQTYAIAIVIPSSIIATIAILKTLNFK